MHAYFHSITEHCTLPSRCITVLGTCECWASALPRSKPSMLSSMHGHATVLNKLSWVISDESHSQSIFDESWLISAGFRLRPNEHYVRAPASARLRQRKVRQLCRLSPKSTCRCMLCYVCACCCYCCKVYSCLHPTLFASNCLMMFATFFSLLQSSRALCPATVIGSTVCVWDTVLMSQHSRCQEMPALRQLFCDTACVCMTMNPCSTCQCTHTGCLSLHRQATSMTVESHAHKAVHNVFMWRRQASRALSLATVLF